MNRSCLHHVIVLIALLHFFHELNTLDACWIVVDVWSNRGRCRQESAYLSWMWCLYNDDCLGYRHDYSIFYQLPNSNLFTHHALYSWEKPLVNPTAPGSTLPSYCFLIYFFAIFVFRSTKPKTQKYIAAYLLFLFCVLERSISPTYHYLIYLITVESVTTSLSRRVASVCCLCAGAAYWVVVILLLVR